MYSLSTFLKPISSSDTTVQIRTPDLVVKYTIAPYTVKNVIALNNLLRVSLDSKRDIVMDFSTRTEATQAAILIESAFETLRERPPLYIDKIVKEYITNITLGPTGSQGPTGPQGFQGFTGPQGFQGFTGPQGFQGDIGPQGPTPILFTASNVVYSPIVSLTASNVQDALDQLDYQLYNAKEIVVKKGATGPGQFSGIKDAVDSITTSSTFNPFIIRVGPGVYFEDTITMKAGIHILGGPLGSVLVIPNQASNTMFIGKDNSSISGLIMNGANNGGTAVYHEGTGGTGFLIKDCNFNNNSTQVNCYGTSSTSTVYIDRCSVTGAITNGFIIGNTSSVSSQIILTNCTYRATSPTLPCDVFVSVSGAGSSITITNTTIRISPTSGTTCIYTEDGGEVRAIASTIRGFEYAIHSGNVGTASNLILDSLSISESLIYDLLIEHPGTTGRFFGTLDSTKLSLVYDSPFYLYNKDLRVITVAKKGAEFTSVADAIDSILDMDFDNRYLVKVNPGVYIEPELDLRFKPYVSVVGLDTQSTIIRPDNVTHPILNLGADNSISFLTLQDSGSGQEAIRVYDTGGTTNVSNISISGCDIGIGVYSNSVDSLFIGSIIKFDSTNSIGLKVVAENGYTCSTDIKNCNYTLGATDSIAVFVSGSGSIVRSNSSTLEGSGGGIGFYAEDGSLLDIISSYTFGFDTAVQSGNVGTSPEVRITGSDISGSNYDVNIEHPDTNGYLIGYTDYLKTYINSSASFFIAGRDQKEIRVSKKGGDFTSIKSAIEYISASASISNSYVVSVGPGVYVEDTITMSPYISLVGSGDNVTTIQASSPNNNIIILSDESQISDLFLTGATSSGSCAILWQSSTSSITLKSAEVRGVKFGNNDTLVRNEPIGVLSLLRLSDVRFGGQYHYNNGFLAISSSGGTGKIQIKSSMNISGHTEPYPNIIFNSTGIGSEIDISGVICNSGSSTPTLTTVANADDGGSLKISGSFFKGWGTVIKTTNTGATPSIYSSGTIFEDSTNNLNILHENTTGFLMGFSDYDKNYISPTSSFFITGKDTQVITVAHQGADFTSIKDAVDSITDNSTSNRYNVSIGSGDYYEDTITLKSYVNLSGNDRTTRIFPNTSTQHLFIGADVSTVSDVLVSGVGSGYAAFYHSNPDIDIYPIAASYSQRAFVIKNVIFGSNDSQVICYGDNNQTNVQVIDSRVGSAQYFDKGFYAYNNNNSTAARILILHCYTQGMANITPTYYAKASGVNCEIVMNSVQANAGSTPQSDTSFLVLENGAKCRLVSVNATGWEKGISNPNVGDPCFISGNAISFQNCNYDISVEQPNTTGTLLGVFDSLKVLSDAIGLGISYADPTAGDFTIAGGLNITYNTNTTTDVSSLISQSSPMGIITGGAITEEIGLTISIGAGFGYYHINEPTYSPGSLYRHDWATTSFMLPASQTSYVYWNSSEILTAGSSIPLTSENILLGRVRTTSTDIEFIEKSPFIAEHWSNKTADFFRQGFGSIYSSGTIVTENTTPFHLDVSSGIYYVGSNIFQPSGGINITFSSYYSNGSGEFIISSTNSIDSSNYSGTNSLIGLSTSYYTKHSLYVIGDNDEEKYLMVYGQDEYELLLNAQNANIPTPPPYFIEGVALIAGIIVQEGTSSIVEIRDQRPVIGFRASGINAASDHSSLLNLSSDDHTQYLLVNGNRNMGGNLNMGGSSITNVNLVDGVDVSLHASRHLPNGSDPLTTGVPSTIGTSNLEGTANALARQDHTHNHGNLNGGLLHATASSTSGGFMSVTDKLKLDSITPIKDASTGIISGGVLSFGTSSNYFAISDGSGQIATNTGSTQSITNISWSGFTNIPLTYLATNLVTFIGLNSSSSVIQQTTPFTREQTRSIISLGAAVHLDNVNLTGFNNLQNVLISPTNQLIDLSGSIGYFNISGNVFSANGSNLKLNKSAGYLYRTGSNWQTNQLDPNVKELPSLTASSFLYRLQNGDNAELNVTDVNPNIYDNNGSTASVPSGKWTVQRIYSFVSNSVTIQLGQYTYNTLTEAKTSISIENYVTDFNLSTNGLLRGFLILQEGTTDISNSVILEPGRFPSSVGVGIPSLTDIQNSISSTSPITYIGGTISINQSTSTQSGYLSSTDWNTFNNKGQTGPTGPQGFQGVAGSQGFQGVTGSQGLQGATGPQGFQGNQGSAGPQGFQGFQGVTGSQGFQGATGPQGPQGNQGFQGVTGSQGFQGVTGSQGFQGNQGFQGVTGSQGFQGVTGSQGFQGATGQGTQGNQGFQGATGPQGSQGQGFQGATGPQGFQGFQGVSDRYQSTSLTTFAIPSPGFTVSLIIGTSLSYTPNQTTIVTSFLNVDAYFGSTVQSYNLSSGNIILLCDTATSSGETYSSWIINLSGAVGSVGDQGPQGFQGNQGFQGATGPQGFQGFQGATGPQGFQGNQGFQGATGPQGFQGNQGLQGATGPQGNQGIQGSTGSQGFQGNQGSTGSQGNQGFQGATGPQGFQGNQGFQGATGPQGFQGNQGFQGATGPQGFQGNQGFQGDTGPQGFQGPTGSVSSVTTQGSPTDPTSTTSTLGVMMGLDQSITPIRSGKILIIISGDIDNSINSRGSTTQIRTGTGAAPTNGSALTGTTRGGAIVHFQSNSSNRSPFSLNAIVSGLTLDTSLWVDISLASVTGGTSRVRNISVSIIEI